MPPGAPAPPNYPIASVDNALRLLLLLGERPSIRLSDAATELGVANSTAHRLLAALAHRGFARQDADRAYRAGPALLDVGLAAVHHLDARSVCRPLLEELSAATGETVHCGVLEAATIRYVDGVESTRVLRVARRTGMALPAHCSAAGKALLARLDPAELRRRYPQPRLETITPRSIKSFSALERALAGVRRAGYAVNRNESEQGVAAVAVVVDDRAGRPVAAVSCAAPLARMDGARAAEIGGLMTRLVAPR
jgi:IclR family transcriptional regulator, acetate operon repressor